MAPSSIIHVVSFDRWCEDRQIAALSSSVAFIPSHANARTRAPRRCFDNLLKSSRGLSAALRHALYVRADPPPVKYMALRITRDVGPASVGNPTIRNFPAEPRCAALSDILEISSTWGTYLGIEYLIST
ncbi:unnamed protein product [Lasius platythorax]|uniref:Uncharacterized protein n=1 Tax=Lasius platythorax TaxID=488582 RepID=A0AAV2NQV4_9HYME